MLPLLEQLDRYCAEVIEKVVVTVNIPEQELLDPAAYRFPVQRVINAKPCGFGANHNAAFKHCGSEWFLVLNPDIRLNGDVLHPLLMCVGADDGVATPRIIEPGSSQLGPQPHRALLTPLEILSRNRPGYYPPSKPDWIPGMFMLLRARAYRQIGGFNTRYFMYGEDFDLCARLRLAGWSICVAENMQVVHDARRASRSDKRHLIWHFASLLKVWASSAFWRYRALLHKRNPNSVDDNS